MAIKENKRILLFVGLVILVWAILSAIFQNTFLSIISFIVLLEIALVIIVIRVWQVVHKLKKESKKA